MVKDNQKDLKQMIEWALAEYHPTAAERYQHHQVRSGQLWIWTLSLSPMPPEVSGFAGSTLALRMHRHITQKATGEVTEETDYAITNLLRPPKPFTPFGAGIGKSRTVFITSAIPFSVRMPLVLVKVRQD